MNKPNFGTRDKKGHWKPPKPASFAPIWEPPVTFKSFIKFLFGWGGYLWPRHLVYAGLAFFTWHFLQPGFSVTQSFTVMWPLFMLIRNLVLMWIIFGLYHLIFYTLKVLGTERKYNPNWMDRSNKKFLFNNQILDNVFMSSVSGGLIWTGYEVCYMWLAANSIVPIITFTSNPVWFVLFFFFIPILREAHFYFIHRVIHWKPLFKSVHYVHHKNVNTGPWSGLSMHPVEHLLYFSSVLFHFLIPSHPIHFLYNSQMTALLPAESHVGFEGPFLRGVLPAGEYFHYLHHKHFSCNFGTGNIPLDRWVGRFYNGEGKYPYKINWSSKKK